MSMRARLAQVAAATAAAAALAAAPAPAAADTWATPALPEGRLTPVAYDNGDNILFLAVDETKAAGQTRELTIVAMMDPPQDLPGGPTSMLVFRARIDCASHQSWVLGSSSFDAKGQMFHNGGGWGPDPVEAEGPFHYVEAAVCHPEGFDAAKDQVTGHVAAQAANAASVKGEK